MIFAIQQGVSTSGERGLLFWALCTQLIEKSVPLSGLICFNIHSAYQQLINLESIAAEDAENQGMIIQIRTHHKTAFSREIAGER